MPEFDEEEFRKANQSLPWKENTYDITGRMIHEDKELQARIREVVSGKTVIEIGCGYNGGLACEMVWLGAESYEGVDPYNCPDINEFMAGRNNARGRLQERWRDKIRFIHQDAASFLEEIQGRERIVTVSAGTLEGSVIHDSRYQSRITAQIARLAKNYPSAVHVTDELFAHLFERQGLALKFARTIESNGFTFGVYFDSY